MQTRRSSSWEKYSFSGYHVNRILLLLCHHRLLMSDRWLVSPVVRGRQEHVQTTWRELQREREATDEVIKWALVMVHRIYPCFCQCVLLRRRQLYLWLVPFIVFGLHRGGLIRSPDLQLSLSPLGVPKALRRWLFHSSLNFSLLFSPHPLLLLRPKFLMVRTSAFIFENSSIVELDDDFLCSLISNSNLLGMLFDGSSIFGLV